jgi:hypothetical protein
MRLARLSRVREVIQQAPFHARCGPKPSPPYDGVNTIIRVELTVSATSIIKTLRSTSNQ